MSIGSVLIGVAVLAVVAAYLARPFRASAAAGPDRSIEAWVAQVREEERRSRSGEEKKSARPVEEGRDDQAVNYCPQCGRRVAPDDRFCSGCGRPLSRRTE